MKLLLLIGLVFSGHFALARQNVNLQGRILNTDGTVFKNAATPFQVSVYNGDYNSLDPSSNCLLYRETQTLDLAATEGAFSLVVGNGTRVNSSIDGGYTIEKIFSNSSAFTSMPAATCPAQSYTPNKSDTRVLIISYYDGSSWDTIPAIPLSWVPQAMYAQDAEKLGGQSLTEFITKSLIPTCNAGSVLTWNGSVFTCVSAGTGTVSSITSANSDISIATSSSTSVLTLNAGTGAHQIVKLDASSKLPAVDGSALTNVTTTVDKIINTVGKYLDYRPNNVACSSGEILKYATGQGWICSSMASAGSVISVSAAGTSGNPIVVSGTNSVSVDLPAATTSANGYLKATDWADFNSKQAGSVELSGLAGITLTGILQRTALGTYTTLGTTAPLSVTGGNIVISQASTGTSGFLSSTDWNSFNGKLDKSGGTLSGTLALPAGTSAAPAISFGSDASSGLYSPASGNIGFATSGTERIRLNSNGNFGIGTTNPTAPLFVAGPGYIGQTSTTTLTSTLQWNEYGTINVASTAGAPDAGYLLINSEVIRYVGKTATSFLLSGSSDRGKMNLGAVVHNNGSTVYPAALLIQKDNTISGALAAVFPEGTTVLSNRLRVPQIITSQNSIAYAVGLINGPSSTILGTAQNSTLFGAYNVANGKNGVAIGNNLNIHGYDMTVLGQCNKAVGTESLDQWVTTDPLLVVGTGTTTGNACSAASNGLMIFKDGTSLFNGRSTITKPTSAAMTVMGSDTSNTLAAFNATDSAGSSKLYIRNDGNVGISNTSPSYRLDVAGNTKIGGHIVTGNSSGSTTVGSCGTSPSISGNDTRGTITNGSGTVTSCVISFAQTYESAPTCIITWSGASAQTTGHSVVASTTNMTVYFSADANGQSFNYICLQ